jgi:X-Pro dipeptidyl-peptidase
MKKAFSVILCLLLMCSLTAGAFAADNQAATKNRAKIHANAAAELENLGFIEEGSFNAASLKVPPTIGDLQNLADFINQPLLSSGTDLSAKLIPNDFYDYFLTVLGYEKETDYNQHLASAFADSLGLPVYSADDFDTGAFYAVISQALKTPTKDGEDKLFDRLIKNGVFDNYNAGRKTPRQLIYDGETYPVFAFDKAIYNQVFVEAPIDTDKDGQRDLIAVWIKRPQETEQGMKTAAIYEFRPYSAGTTDAYDYDEYNNHIKDAVLEKADQSTKTTAKDFRYKTSNDKLPKERKPKSVGQAENLSAFPVNVSGYDYWLVRGYAVVFAAGPGTRYSDGLSTCGSEEEILSAKAVVDWLCGRAKAYTDKTSNIEVKASWCNGNVAMTGRSYAGTVPFAVATTGVQGLKTIVPIAGIASWYDYYRANGTPSGALYYPGDDCDLLAEYCMSRKLDADDYAQVQEVFEAFLEEMDRETAKFSGDYNVFWDERNYTNNANKIKASALIFHGLNDFNVKTKQFDMMYKAFQQSGRDVKLVLHQGAHMTPDRLDNFDYYGLLNRWFAYWLNDVKNDVLAVPNVQIQSNTDLNWKSYDTWPEVNKTVNFFADEHKRLQLNPGQGASVFTSDLTGAFDTAIAWNEYATDELYSWQDAIVGMVGNDALRAQFITEPLEVDMEINGTINVNIEAKADYPTGILSAMLVDYAPDGMEAPELKKYSENVPTIVVQKEGLYQGGGLKPMDLIQFQMTPVNHKIISRGWMDIQNRKSIYNVDTITPGEYYQFTIDLQPMNYTVKAGHQLALIIYSIDVPFTYWPAQVTNFTINHAGTSVEIPMAE